MTLRPQVSEYMSRRNRTLLIYEDGTVDTGRGPEIQLRIEEYKHGTADKLHTAGLLSVITSATELDAIYLTDKLPATIPQRYVADLSAEEKTAYISGLLHRETVELLQLHEENY